MDTNIRPTEVVYVRLPRELKDRMRELAARRHGGNMAEMMRYLMDQYVRTIEEGRHPYDDVIPPVD